MDHSRHRPLQRHEMTESVLIGAPVYGAGDEVVGRIDHIHGNSPVTQVVIDVGGFLGIGSRSVLIAIDQLNLMRDEDGVVHGVTEWTKDHLLELPEHRH